MFSFSEFQRELAGCDHGEERRWRYLDSSHFKTILEAKVVRAKCPEHGAKTVNVPWAEPHRRFKILFERFATTSVTRTTITYSHHAR
jgi:hypothetical protein